MDGTVLDRKGKLTVENKKWIRRAIEEGIVVIFATGRIRENVLAFTWELGLQSPIVTVNGGEVWGTPHSLLNRYPFDYVWIDKLVRLAQQYDVRFRAIAVERLFDQDTWVSGLEEQEWIKFSMYHEDRRILDDIRRVVTDWDVMDITNSNPNNLEFNPKGISKARGVKEVCEHLGIQMSEVVAIGDSLNDALMIQHAGLGVAMGNAQDEVKEVADMVVATNDESGVARLISEVILI